MLLANATATPIKDSAGEATSRLQFNGVEDRCFQIAVKSSLLFFFSSKFVRLKLDRNRVVYLNVNSASKRLGISKAEIRRQCKAGTFVEFAKRQIQNIQRFSWLHKHLTMAEIAQIHDYVASHRQEWRDSGTSCFIHRSKDLPRSIEYDHEKDRVFIHLNRRHRGDPVLGTGASKVVKTSIDFDAGKSAARFTVGAESREVAFFELFGEKTPGVIKTYKVTEFQGKKGTKVGVIQERGVCLFDLLFRSSRRLTLYQRDQIAIQLLIGLVSVHAQKVVHRDIKPENVILAEQDGILVAKITDFGFSLFEGQLAETIDGTEGYMSQDAFGPWPKRTVDMFAMGVTLQRLYSRRTELDTDIDFDQLRRRDRVIQKMMEVDYRKRISADVALALLQQAIN